MPTIEVTSTDTASAASKVLRNKKTSKVAKSTAGSALSQSSSPTKSIFSKVGAAASETLRSGKSSKASKTLAGSALTQRHNESNNAA